jgi:hypothetical protein
LVDRNTGGPSHVGWTGFARGHGADPAKLGPEEWAVRTVGKDLVLTGGRPRGTLYAVYEFLEQDLGCHWLDERTEVVPSRPTLPLPHLRRTGKPAFRSREVYDLVRGFNETESGWTGSSWCARRTGHAPEVGRTGPRRSARW